MTIILEPYTIPEKGKVELNVKHSFEIKVTAEEARGQVNRWLHEHVTMLIGAEAATLVVGEHFEHFAAGDHPGAAAALARTLPRLVAAS